MLEAVGIGVARGIEPGQRHAFAVVRGGEQAIDEAFVGAGFFVGQEGSEFGGRGREAGEIQADAADQRRPRGLGRRGQFFGFEAGEDEAVDGILNPVFAADGGRRRACRGGERPMRRERRAFGDPAAQGVFLRGGKDAVGIGGGHLLVLFGREDAGDEFAFVGLAGDDDVVDPLALAGVEPELGFAFRGVLAVAVKTIFREDGADVLGVVDRCWSRRGGRGHEGDDEN